MPEKESMLKDVTSKTAALPLVGAAFLSGAFQRICAQEQRLVNSPLRHARIDCVAGPTSNDRDLIVLYVGRDRSQFDSGHIPGSRFVRLDDLVEQREDSLNELPSVADLQATFESLGVSDRSRVVLTDDAAGVLAARAYFTLDYLGHGDQAALLDGGLKTWIAESRATSKEEPPVARTEFSPRVHSDILVSTAQMRQLSLSAEKGEDYSLLDARPVAEHTGVVNSESVPQAGHIAGSQSLYWKKLIRSDSRPRLLDPEELQEQFVRVGAGPGKLGRHLLPDRHAVFVHIFRRQIPWISSCYVRRLGVRVGSRSGQPTGDLIRTAGRGQGSSVSDFSNLRRHS